MGTTGILTLDDESLMVSCYGMPKIKSARETGREITLKVIEKADVTIPRLFLYECITREEDYIKGIQDIIGRVSCLGESAADNYVEGIWTFFIIAKYLMT